MELLKIVFTQEKQYVVKIEHVLVSQFWRVELRNVTRESNLDGPSIFILGFLSELSHK